MTEPQVAALLGEPRLTTLDTCGRRATKPWQCKEKDYGNRLIVWFRYSESRRAWVVNHWILD